MNDLVDHMTVDCKHQVYFAVRTREASVNGSGDVLTQRAKLNWRWHADGDVDQTTQVWTQAGTGITGDANFTEVTSGDVVPPDAAANINGILQGDLGWKVL
jgi:hypothetical protein